MYKLAFAILILCTISVLHAQQKDSSAASGLTDAPLRLSLGTIDSYPMSLVTFSDFSYFKLYEHRESPQSLHEHFIIDSHSLNKQLLGNFKQKMIWQQSKYDLGVVGQILDYAGYAAAFGLAAYHVIKYKEKALPFN